MYKREKHENWHWLCCQSGLCTMWIWKGMQTFQNYKLSPSSMSELFTLRLNTHDWLRKLVTKVFWFTLWPSKGPFDNFSLHTVPTGPYQAPSCANPHPHSGSVRPITHIYTNTHSSYSLRLWIWWQHVPSKCWQNCPYPHSGNTWKLEQHQQWTTMKAWDQQVLKLLPREKIKNNVVEKLHYIIVPIIFEHIYQYKSHSYETVSFIKFILT